MHEPVRDGLDEAIDRTIRAMLQVEPDATFDARVRPRHAPRVPQGPLMLAAAAAGVFLLAISPGVVRWFEPPSRPDDPPAAGASPRARPSPIVAGPEPPAPPPRQEPHAAARDASGRTATPQQASDGLRQPAGARSSQPWTSGAAVTRDAARAVAQQSPRNPGSGADPLSDVTPLPPIAPLRIAAIEPAGTSQQAKFVTPLDPISAIEIAPLSPSEWRE